ncbi:Sel1-repeat containing protein [Gracilaria domingensis]|nr:Sel1-repeat containing protein [Gracilaria domingensis]
MCASAVAAILAALLGLRTTWGLWQLHEFRLWAEQSIDALDAVGIKYRLHGTETQLNEKEFDRVRGADIADAILVNEKIVDNQIMHGDVHCYLKFGGIELLTNKEENVKLLSPIFSAGRWIVFSGAVLLECVRRVFRSRKSPRTTLKQVPMKPVDVWIHWAAAFASQGLQQWMSEFRVALEPATVGEDTTRRTAVERFREKGEYFAAELLASATLHLWGEHGPEQGLSPFLWREWGKQSEMSDGRVVKQELFRDAIMKGECLPFGAGQFRNLLLSSSPEDELRVGYDSYRESLAEFVSELPIQSSFVQEMRRFDVNMLEWLTIVLHLGCIARSSRQGGSREDEGEEYQKKVKSRGLPLEGSQSSDDSGIEGVGIGRAMRCDEVVNTLRLQLNMKEIGNSDSLEPFGLVTQSGVSENLNILSAIPIMRHVISVSSDGNRLVPKVGELMDIWLSLTIGDQIRFLVEKLNDDWEDMCLGKDKTVSCDEDIGERWELREAHVQVEKRRLERRVANTEERYKYLDQFVTYMGYRMESVRSIMGRWVAGNEGKSGKDLFLSLTRDVLCQERIDVELSEGICVSLKEVGLIRRRGLQCRLIWELQNYLERFLICSENWNDEEELGRVRVGVIMLFILSFPGLRIDAAEEEFVPAIEQGNGHCCINLERFAGVEGTKGSGRNSDGRRQKEARRKARSQKLELWAMCGPQKFVIVAEIGETRKCNLRLLSDERNGFEWEWWRDAFEGRLEGFEEWQKDIGISALELSRRSFRNEASVIVDVSTITETKMRIWSEWTPFRTEFCRFELESTGFLKEPQVDGYKESIMLNKKLSSTFHIGMIPIQKVKAISYNDAKSSVLKHTCLMVQKILDERKAPEADKVLECDGSYISSQSRANRLLEASRRFPDSQALMLYRIAALHYRNSEGLRRSVEILCGEDETVRDVSQALSVLRSFVGTLLSPNYRVVKPEAGGIHKMELVVLPACQRLLQEIKGSESDVEGMSEILAGAVRDQFH